MCTGLENLRRASLPFNLRIQVGRIPSKSKYGSNREVRRDSIAGLLC